MAKGSSKSRPMPRGTITKAAPNPAPGIMMNPSAGQRPVRPGASYQGSQVPANAQPSSNAGVGSGAPNQRPPHGGGDVPIPAVLPPMVAPAASAPPVTQRPAQGAAQFQGSQVPADVMKTPGGTQMDAAQKPANGTSTTGSSRFIGDPFPAGNAANKPLLDQAGVAHPISGTPGVPSDEQAGY